MKVTISEIEIIPSGNLSNIVISENIDKFELKFGKNHITINAPIVSTQATIWFSVKLDANIPNEIYAKLNKKNPNKVDKATFKEGSPNCFNIK